MGNRHEETLDPDDWSALTRGEKIPTAEVVVSWAMGGAKLSDFIWTTSLAPVIVHRRVIELLQELTEALEHEARAPLVAPAEALRVPP